MRITKTTEIKHFCEIQHLKYIANVTRLGNDSLQKQSQHRRKKLSELTGIDESQLRRLMIDRKEFTRLLSTLITEAPDENKFSYRDP